MAFLNIKVLLIILTTNYWMQQQLASSRVSDQNVSGFTLTTRLIHRDTVRHALANPSSPNSSTDDTKFIMSCGEEEDSASSCIDYIEAEIVPSQEFGFFYVKFYVGDDPSLEQYAVMDTGSQLNWIECEPSTDKRPIPIYDSRQSTTFKNLSCYTSHCWYLGGKCDGAKYCSISQSYMTGYYVEGEVGTDVLSFDSAEGGRVQVPDVVLGCSHNNTQLKGVMGGIMGLGGIEASLAGRFGWRFSYCVGKVYDSSYPYNQLALGNGARFEGPSTPLEVDRKYYVTLLGISLGGDLLNIPYDTFKRDVSQNRGVFVDSGSELTLLTSVAYELLYAPVYDMFPSFHRHRLNGGRLCVQGQRSIHADPFPPLVFHFSGGVELIVRSSSLFHQVNQLLFCMTIQPSKNNYSVIGMSSMQGYNVGFNVPSKLIYFENVDCRLVSTEYI